jgi:hypothetical protein
MRRVLGLLMMLGLLVGSLGFALMYPSAPLAPVQWSTDAGWISLAEPAYRFYTRKTFYAPEQLTAAWIQISADDDFVLHINGRQSVVRENGALNAPKGLAYRRKVPFQDYTDNLTYEARTSLNYLMTSSPDWKISVYVDLTTYLVAGKNAIAIEVQQGAKSARLAVDGEVRAPNQPPIRLTTGGNPPGRFQPWLKMYWHCDGMTGTMTTFNGWLRRFRNRFMRPPTAV